MKPTITFSFTTRETKLIVSNSIERVINTSIFLLSADDDNSSIREMTDINLTDWEDLKPLVRSIWFTLQEAIFATQRAEAQEKEHLSRAAKGSNF